MRIRIFRSVIVVLLFASLGPAQMSAQILGPQSEKMPGRFAPFGPSNGQVTSLSPDRASSRAPKDERGAFKPHDGTKDLKHQDLNLKLSNLKTIPFWSDTFDYHGLQYTYKMVGTDPKRGSATTVIPVELIPIRWVFSNGTVVDGETAIQGILDSPIFQNYDFTSGGTHVGNTQFADAFQRANFWDSVSTKAPNYHVRLTPTVLPTQTIVVPDDKVTFFLDPESATILPEIDDAYLSQIDHDLHSSLGISPQSLPIIVWGRVQGESAGGYHGAYQAGNSVQTYISTGYFPTYDVAILSHEIIEWLDDPFGDNYSAGWNSPFYAGDPPPVIARCDSWFFASDLLEVSDPFETLGIDTFPTLTVNGSTYHIAEGAFIDFFTRNNRSRSVNGQYSFFEQARPLGFDTPPSAECVSSVHTTNQFFTVPDSSFTYASGMNNTGSIVGYYRDTANRAHGFKKDRAGYTTIDFPGATTTALTDINDGGTMVGYYYDANGFPRGFSLKSGRFTSIDFPGSSDTLPEKINSEGVIVGAFDVTQPITRGFVLDSGGFQAVDAPYGQQSEAAAINDSGVMAGNSWTDAPGLQSGFTKTKKGFTRFDFPDQSITDITAINTFGDLGGFYLDADPGLKGFVRLFGYPYVTYPYSYEYIVTDINDKREILGQGYNFDAGEYQPFIGAPALAR